MPVELGFILLRLAAMAEADESLRKTQPWQAAHEKDYAWLGEAMTKHYNGDDSDVRLLIGGDREGVCRPERRGVRGGGPSDSCTTASTRRSDGGFNECGYVPMIELLRYLEANGFTNYITSGGDRDFMRPVTWSMSTASPPSG